MNVNVFGERLKELREEKGITREQLAGTLNLSYWAISKYEQNERRPDQEILNKIADYFDCSADYLLGRTDIRKPRSSDDVIDLAESSHKFFWKGRELTAEELQGLLVGEEARRNHILKLLDKKQKEKK